MLDDAVFDEGMQIKFKCKLSELMHNIAMPHGIQILIFKLFSYPHTPAKILLTEFSVAFNSKFKAINVSISDSSVSGILINFTK